MLARACVIGAAFVLLLMIVAGYFPIRQVIKHAGEFHKQIDP